MFGEDDSESPRAPSPWDPFLSSPPSEAASLEKCQHMCHSIPKLVPEVEEGNVEYKLKLTDIPPARFARLVTQLKWRLLEGGGQAYYELGVADSGALIGLSRLDLDQSLETLEMMAGEIGASVIVVKEIEVPPSMVALADKVSEYIDPETGEWTDKMVNKRSRGLPYYDLDADSAFSAEESLTDIDELSSDIATPIDMLDAGAIFTKSGRLLPSNPERPTAQSSPFIAPIDDDLALFSMEPEPAFTVEPNDPVVSEFTTEPPAFADPDVSLNIEISSVFKPRPMRRRPPHSVVGSSNFGHRGLRTKVKEKRVQSWHQRPPSSATPVSVGGIAVSDRPETKALQRRLARDKRREEKRKALVARAEGGCIEDDSVTDARTGSTPEDETTELVAGLSRLLVDAEFHEAEVLIGSEPVTDIVDLTEPGIRIAVETPMESHDAQAPSISKEPRLIVEALVVRKMSIEEAFLDFGGFSLT